MIFITVGFSALFGSAEGLVVAVDPVEEPVVAVDPVETLYFVEFSVAEMNSAVEPVANSDWPQFGRDKALKFHCQKCHRNSSMNRFSPAFSVGYYCS